MDMYEVYRISLECTNCRYQREYSFPKGELSKPNTHECSYCGCRGTLKKLWR